MRAGVPYRRVWTVNAVQTRVNAAQFQRVLALSRVTRVATPPPPVEAASAGTASIAAAAAGEWGVSRLKAPWACNQGYAGQGIVIAGQDTGYTWDHPALINAYRGYNPAAGSAKHDYNWHDSIHSDLGAINPGGTNPCGYNSLVPCDDYGHGTHTMGTMAGNDLAPAAPVDPPPRSTPSAWPRRQMDRMLKHGPRRLTSNASSG